MNIRATLIIVIIILCISVMNNMYMYYKFYVKNDSLSDCLSNNPFVPENIGVYHISVYYNKYNYMPKSIYEELKPALTDFETNNHGKYILTFGKPTQTEYAKIAELNTYKLVS